MAELPPAAKKPLSALTIDELRAACIKRMRRLLRLRELGAPPEICAKEVDLIWSAFRMLVKRTAGLIPRPEEWPKDVHPVLAEVVRPRLGAAIASATYARIRELEVCLDPLAIRNLEISGAANSVILNGEASTEKIRDQASTIAKENGWTNVTNQIRVVK
ncbi:MAG: hypothetical protein ABI183_21215 [Polyangiaceae bacterium]